MKLLKKQIEKKYYDIIYIKVDGVKIYTRKNPVNNKNK